MDAIEQKIREVVARRNGGLADAGTDPAARRSPASVAADGIDASLHGAAGGARRGPAPSPPVQSPPGQPAPAGPPSPQSPEGRRPDARVPVPMGQESIGPTPGLERAADTAPWPERDGEARRGAAFLDPRWNSDLPWQ